MQQNKKTLSKREGLILYWCEGDKPSGRNYSVAITTSDYFIAKNFLFWLEKYYNVPISRVKLKLHLWPISNEEEAKKYWSDKLNISLQSFTKSYIKDKSGKNNKYKNGICRVSIHSKEILLDILKNIENEFC